MTTVFTIGYEGASPEDFIATLILAGVKQVLDVRELAQSRRRGFSKTALSQALAEHGMSYCHFRQLGDPKPGREAARRGDLSEFKKIFNAHLELAETKAALQDAAELIQSAPSVLVCFERNPQHCHRTLVAQQLTELCSASVQHLGVVENAEQRHRVVAEAT